MRVVNPKAILISRPMQSSYKDLQYQYLFLKTTLPIRLYDQIIFQLYFIYSQLMHGFVFHTSLLIQLRIALPCPIFNTYQKLTFPFHHDMIYQLQVLPMQSQHKKWTRKFQGNQRLLRDVKNPLRYYIEEEIKKISLKEFPDRPAQPVDISIGDPTNSVDFKTNPSNIQIISKNVGKIDGYTKFVGSDQARESVAQKFQAPNYKVAKENVFLTAGGSLAIWAVIMLLANEGDNFLFPSPGFPLAGVIADSIGLKIRFYHLKPQDWKTDLKEMESLIDDRTKFIYINDPSNPLGSCWSDEHKKQIIELARVKNLPILADQIYENVTYGEPCKTFAELAPEEVTIFKCSGLTKRWLGPGWRLGWLIVYAKEQAFKQYYGPLKNISNILLMPHTIMQSSVKEILQNPTNDEYMHSRMEIMAKNQRILQQNLDKESYCSVGNASGALYATILMKMDKFNEETLPNIIEFCKRLYSEENIMIFPGKFFNSSETFLRLTISCSNSIIEEFVIRFKRFCSKHLKKQE